MNFTEGKVRSRLYRISLAVVALVVCLAAADGSWLRHVPQNDHNRVNPLSGQPEAVAAGRKLFMDHCAKCHGETGLGDGKHPSLRTARIQEQVTEGDIAWLLKNGNLAKGMPAWSGVPEPSRWQIIAFVKSLGRDEAPAVPASTAKN